ncbi:hypothetical protein [Micromonospora auratinigra]|uniref:Uncharacterized protein n=1 Tax=Micromonospora auratinigra TaxID=261654 RepID=A0A1A8Z5S3_9ACTN|nr:hypothetical protein [Micromonospora auratinigra]SBT39162.1 hypothetical protein GA0070611_0813 [Micromonospora auratinigra]
MTTESVPADGDPRRLLSEARGLARRVRVDQRVTWSALLVLAVVTFVGIPFDWLFLVERCGADGTCQFSRQGVLYYWPVALLLAYAVIAFCYVRVARTRGLGARVLPYALTGAALTILFTATWIAARLYLPSHPRTTPFPDWVLVLDRLISPWGTIGVALLVLARLERHLGLLLFTIGYLAVVLVPLAPDVTWGAPRPIVLPQQLISGTVLLLGAAGFALADRRRR